MEVHRQTCQACGSRTMNNLLVREPGKSDKVFVKCASCKELVARYSISHGGYYHHGKGFESFIRSLARSGESMSGKTTQNEFLELKESILESYGDVQQYLRENDKEA